MLIASAAATTSGTQTETVTPGPALSLAVAPASASVPARGSKQFSAFGRDSFGNLFPVAAAWTLSPPNIGSLSPVSGNTTSFVASRCVGQGTITATLVTPTGTLTSGASLTVVPARLRIAVLHFQKLGQRVFVSLLAVDPAGKSVAQAHVSVLVRRNGRPYYSRRVTTGAAGRVSFRLRTRRGGCFTSTVTRVSALGFTWDGHSPRNRLCVAPPRRH